MSDRIESTKSLIDPVYSQNEPNQPIDLGTVAIGFDRQGTTHREMAKVMMAFMPNNRLEFVVEWEASSSFLRRSGAISKITLLERGMTFDCFIGGSLSKSDGSGRIVLFPRRSPVTVTAPTSTISFATFHLLNSTFRLITGFSRFRVLMFGAIGVVFFRATLSHDDVALLCGNLAWWRGSESKLKEVFTAEDLRMARMGVESRH